MPDNPIAMILVALSAALFASATATLQPGCNLTVTNEVDYGSTTRCVEYPDGVSVNLSACKDLCCATDDCTLFTWLDGAPPTCWPLQSASGAHNNTNKDHYVGAPPQLPPPTSWATKIAKADMLYAPTDAFVP